VIVLDAADRIQYVNPATETLLGISGVLLVGVAVEQMFEQSPELLMAVRTARTQQETVIEYEIDVAANGHPPIRLGCSISPQERPQGAMLIEMRRSTRTCVLPDWNRRACSKRPIASCCATWRMRSRIRWEAFGARRNCWNTNCHVNHCVNIPSVIIKESDRLQSLLERLLTPHRALPFGAVNIHEVLERVRSLV